MNKRVVLHNDYAPVGNLPLPYPCEMPRVMPKPLLQGYESTKMVKKLPLYRYESTKMVKKLPSYRYESSFLATAKLL
ncbi:hypothetical protein OU798_16435 [Prolixibacteraceae bacterium Z1-6]|uniref:Uncharacterized protein n=1 Tax=Draconibacterium aestuarii TaxID=2998507 RepID=A0A9X3FFU0_9BACT|nr:hypothetical protein [Prolixibacteraceae bacterium Z1-6]